MADGTAVETTIRFTAKVSEGMAAAGIASIAVDDPAASPSIVVSAPPGGSAICFVESPDGQLVAYMSSDSIYGTIHVADRQLHDISTPFGSSTGPGCPHLPRQMVDMAAESVQIGRVRSKWPGQNLAGMASVDEAEKVGIEVVADEFLQPWR